MRTARDSGFYYPSRWEQVEAIVARLRAESLFVFIPSGAIPALLEREGPYDGDLAFLENGEGRREAFREALSRADRDRPAIIDVEDLTLKASEGAPPDGGASARAAEKARAAVFRLFCNQRDIMRFLEGDGSLREEAPIWRMGGDERERNGCAGKCHVAERCICGGGSSPACFPSPDRICPFCSPEGRMRACGIVNAGTAEGGFRPIRWPAEDAPDQDRLQEAYDSMSPALGRLYRMIREDSGLDESGGSMAGPQKAPMRADDDKMAEDFPTEQPKKMTRLGKTQKSS